ncbi:glycoside hydrolase/deacetylase [Sordaria brevicollis]|uniref:Glycoside hydrolase/deacetylase n=1 Tax=Sordaria brevicollis TaxID=83679 RepID=A0AAE0PF59_SORBR|nr:glycoside hydrolase/deacetylase [Sordaria brevicollis]
MLLGHHLATVVAGLLTVTTVNAACTSDLVIDDFAKWVEGTNNLNWPNGDDGSMSSIAAAAGKVQFIPKDSGSYFYESFSCQQAITTGYGGIQFTLQGPAGGSVALELQTSASCNDTGSYTSSYNIITGLTGSQQTIDMPLIGFDNNPNYDAIVGLVWSEFSQTNSIWSIGNIKLTCGAVAAPTTTTAVPTAKPTTTRSVITTTTRSVITTATRSTSAAPTATACSNLLIDDWESQSRLTFLGYNAMNQASSDDGTMSSIVVSSNRVLLTPKNQQSYFYSQFGCLNTANKYGGISFRIRAARGTTFAVQMSYFATCGSSTGRKTISLTSTQLKWTFDGTERLYWFPFTVFTGLDTTKLDMIYFTSFNAAVIFGPMSFYCGSTASEYIPQALPAPSNPVGTSPTLPSPSSPAKTALVIDTFGSVETNSLGQWHGGDDGMTVTFGRNQITIRTNDSDLGWNTQLGAKCFDLTPYSSSYLHIAYSGSNKFSVALQQHNSKCDDSIKPYPETWDSLEAARYSFNNDKDIYIPISHFSINLTRSIGFNLRGFYSPSESTVISKIELLPTLPSSLSPSSIPPKLASGKLVFACTRPNSFAFAIDDGDPALASRVMAIVTAANIPVTFFTVGLPLLDPTTNLSQIYRSMAAKGHQIALHSYTHPKMEGLTTTGQIDWEYQNDIGAMLSTFPSSSLTPYFRPPFGTEGARMRQRLVANLATTLSPSRAAKAHIVGWSIDVEDWLWAESKTPEKQLEAFKRDLARGGNLVVMHYLHESTVGYLEEFIKLAKGTGRRLMRVDQCMEDGEAPALT